MEVLLGFFKILLLFGVCVCVCAFVFCVCAFSISISDVRLGSLLDSVSSVFLMYYCFSFEMAFFRHWTVLATLRTVQL